MQSRIPQHGLHQVGVLDQHTQAGRGYFREGGSPSKGLITPILYQNQGEPLPQLSTTGETPSILNGFQDRIDIQTSGLSQSNYYYEGDISLTCLSLLSRSRYPNNSAPI